ncbi:MAG TPA: radical SAM protein [Syntrophomonadaceae bacterium]|nr:radical SAM protein [Syntrophomonadaceae bacterium]HPR93575.1 radical SAM protein [Syntrophomonadaceae bacterium]
MSHFNIPVFIPHLGCPFQCIFCNQQKITSVSEIATDRDIQKIIDTAIKTLPADREAELAFFGGSFTAINQEQQQHYLGLVKPYIDLGAIKGIRISTRPDFIDRKGLELLLSAGVTTIELGVQSLDDQVLKASGRGYKSQAVNEAVALIHQYPFKLGIQLMIGLPEDNMAADIETTARTIGLKPDMVRIYPTLVIEETPLAAMYKAGKYQPLSLTEAVKISLQMYLRFQQADIDVIRMGLHADEELTRGSTVMAGPFHPGFGELVQQEAYKEQVSFILQELPITKMNIKQVKLFANQRDLSKLIGFRRGNIEYWQQQFKLEDITVQSDKFMPRDAVCIVSPQSLFQPIEVTRLKFIKAYLNQ